MPAVDREEFDRQPGESDKAWKAFTTYRDLGYDRTLEKARVLLGKPPGYARVLEGWSVRWGWRDRVEAWDRELDKKSRAADIQALEEMRQRHIKLSTALLGLGAVELNKWIQYVQDAQTQTRRILSAMEIMKLIEAGIKLERGSRGEPESIVEERHQLSAADERESLRGLLNDPKTLEAVDKVMEKLNGKSRKRSPRS